MEAQGARTRTRHEHSVSIPTAAAKSTEKNTALIFSLPFFFLFVLKRHLKR